MNQAQDFAFMRRALLMCILALLAGTVTALGAAPILWQSRYLYEADYGKNAAGTGMVVEYRLTVNGPEDTAILTEEGYQTDETIYCNVTYTGENASFYFKSFGGGRIENQYGIIEYQPGQLLFVLERPEAQEFKGLITHWKALNPDDRRKSGFVRVPAP
ncbi:MAG: DUF5991 domain-containing protein [Candidatus Binataceae bacterium]